MQNLIGVQILKPYAHFYENPPNALLGERSILMRLDELVKIALPAPLHHNEELLADLLRAHAAHNVRMDEFADHARLIQGVIDLEGQHVLQIDLLEHVLFPISPRSGAIHHCKPLSAQQLTNFKLVRRQHLIAHID